LLDSQLPLSVVSADRTKVGSIDQATSMEAADNGQEP